MMVYIEVCDKCGRITQGHYYRVHLYLRETKKGDIIFDDDFNVTFCPECYKHFKKFVDEIIELYNRPIAYESIDGQKVLKFEEVK